MELYKKYTFTCGRFYKDVIIFGIIIINYLIILNNYN